MAQRNEIAAVYVAGVIQGVALVTFPAASAVFTSASDYGLSSTAYGGMFVPQAITAIGSSLLGAGLVRRLGLKRIYLLGLAADLLAMVLLVLSQWVMSHGLVAYSLLLLATTSLGIGFGLTVPALNTFTAAFFPQKIDSAVLILNALLGLGTALAPHNILVVGVGPGAVATPINLSTMKDPVAMKKLDDAIPLGRMAKPEEIASVVAFLAGDGANYITATTVFTDGGIMHSSPGL